MLNWRIFCTDICEELNQCLFGKEMDELTKSVCDAIDQVALWVELVICISDHHGRTQQMSR